MELNDNRYNIMLQDIAEALETYMPEVELFFDLDDYAVVPCSISPGQGMEFYPTEGHRVIRIWPIPSNESFDIMVDFADQVSDEKMRNRLFHALSVRHPFRTFKNELSYDTALLNEWHAFREARLLVHARQWLDENQITLVNGKLESPECQRFCYNEYFDVDEDDDFKFLDD